MMRAGELDTQTPIPAANIDWLRKNMGEELKLVDYLGVSYLTLNCQRAPFTDKRIREVVALAYDRETIANKIMKLGERSAYAFVPPHVANYPGGPHFDFEQLSYPERIKKAQSLMIEAGYGPNKHLHTVYETTSDPDNKRIAAALQSMLRQVYLDIDIVQVDVQIHYKNMETHDLQCLAPHGSPISTMHRISSICCAPTAATITDSGRTPSSTG